MMWCCWGFIWWCISTNGSSLEWMLMYPWTNTAMDRWPLEDVWVGASSRTELGTLLSTSSQKVAASFSGFQNWPRIKLPEPRQSNIYINWLVSSLGKKVFQVVFGECQFRATSSSIHPHGLGPAHPTLQHPSPAHRVVDGVGQKMCDWNNGEWNGRNIQ